MKVKQTFKFAPFSQKQKRLMSWWCEGSPLKNCDGIIADGAARSGKTLSMSMSFIFWAMTAFNNQKFGMCGKTISSFRRNVLLDLKRILPRRGYRLVEHRTDNLVVISKGDVQNFFFIFGGKDEGSQDLIQGMTLAGVLFDEVVLQTESFVQQALLRCSVTGSKYWFNCNPQHPLHWFKTDFVDKHVEKNLIYLHFLMTDNLSLSKENIKRYERDFMGVFYDRFVKGLWVRAEGAIYTMFDKERHVGLPEPKTKEEVRELTYIDFGIGIDVGGRDATVYTLWGFTRGYRQAHVISSWYHKQAKGQTVSYDDYSNSFFKWIHPWMLKYPGIKNVFVESADKLFRILLNQRKPMWATNLNFIPSYKGPSIHDRIEFICMLLNEGRIRINPSCKQLINALQSAMWSEKHPDQRLDDGSSDIDSLDSMEYGIIPYKGEFIAAVKRDIQREQAS